jgi:hypothetical protein
LSLRQVEGRNHRSRLMARGVVERQSLDPLCRPRVEKGSGGEREATREERNPRVRIAKRLCLVRAEDSSREHDFAGALVWWWQAHTTVTVAVAVHTWMFLSVNSKGVFGLFSNVSRCCTETVEERQGKVERGGDHER